MPKADGPRGPRRPQRPGGHGGQGGNGRKGPPRDRAGWKRDEAPRGPSGTEGGPRKGAQYRSESGRPFRPDRNEAAGSGEARGHAPARPGARADARAATPRPARPDRNETGDREGRERGPTRSGPRTGTRATAPRPARPPRGKGAAPSVRQAAADGTPREGDRIAKLLARAGVASRRDIERMIEEGRIALNGETVTTPATLLKSLHGVTVDGKPVNEPEAARLFLFHKPAGFLTAARDPRGRPTIYDRLPADMPRVMPVGRLDMTTEGLLLLTTDGGLKRQLELPSTGIERTYRARAFGTVTQAQLEELIDGVEIDGMRYGRIDANLERRSGHNQWIEMTITEGKNREVRRVLEYLGLTVNRLIRTRYGPFTLDESEPGALMEVRQSDLNAFRKTLKK